MEVIRGELRCALAEERSANRASLLRQKRPALSDTNEKLCFLSPEDVAIKAELLKESSLSGEDYILLQNSLSKDRANIDEFFKVENIQEALARDLTCADPARRLLAAGCCCNVALGGPSICVSLVQAIGPYLVAELYSQNYPLSEACARAIGNIIAGEPTPLRVWYAESCVNPLTELTARCNDSALPSVAYALKHCLRAGRGVFTNEQTERLTDALVNRKIFPQDRESLWTLALLSSRESSHERLFSAIPKILRILWQILVDPDLSDFEQVAPGIRILGNSVTEPSGRAADMFLSSSSSDNVASFLNKFLSWPERCVQKETLWLLGNLYTHRQLNIRIKVKTNLLPLLGSLQGVG